MSDDHPRPLRDTLRDFGDNLGLKDPVSTGVVWSKWDEIVGPEVGKHAEPTSLRDGVLRVRTESPTWATEIGYFAGEITRRINEVVGRQLVTEVRVWTGPGALRARPDRAAGGPQPDNKSATKHPERSPTEALAAARAAWERARRRG